MAPADDSRAASLRILSGPDKGSGVTIRGDQFLVGRSPRCDLVIADPQVSARHARITPVADGVLLEDLGSANGTMVNGARIAAPFLLHGGERLQLGNTHLLVSVPWLLPPPPAAGVGLAGLSTEPVLFPPESTSSLSRRLLRVSVKRTSMLAVAAIVTSVTAVALLLTGVAAQRDKSPTLTAPTTPGSPTTPEIIASVAPSTVLIESLRNDRLLKSGTGWALDAANGLIVTNFHVVNEATSFRVSVDDQQRSATLFAAAPCEDLAVLKVADTSGLQTLPLGSQNSLRLGDAVVAVGYPVNASRRDQLTATAGVVSVVRASVEGDADAPSLPDVVQTDAAINPGNSGGPLVSNRKELVGVNTFSLLSAGGRTLQNTNYAIGVDRVKEVTATLREGRSMAWTGASVTSPDASQLTMAGLPRQSGLMITGAVPGTPAVAAGVGREPALLVAIDGHRIDSNLTSYCDALNGAQSGQTVRLTLYEAGSSRTTDIPVALA